MKDIFWQSDHSDRMKGFCHDHRTYQCLFCDFEREEGYVYPYGDNFIVAKKAMEIHIEEAHGGVLTYLTGLDKKQSGLSDQQSSIIRLFYEGISDHEVQKQLGIGSISTVRNHRHALKDKERQAKTMAVVFDLLNQVTPMKAVKVKPHATATMIDDRYDITDSEEKQVIAKYFPDGPEGKLTNFYVKEKHKIIILKQIVRHFEEVRRYREKEVDEILKEIYLEDYVLIRRYLIQYGFLDREKDGSYYWVKEVKESKEKEREKTMDKNRKKELARAYKVQRESEGVESGVFQIRNKYNGKIYLGTARDIHKMEGLKFQLNSRTFPNAKLQEDWESLGEDSFAIEILECFKEEGTNQEIKKRLNDMKKKWMDQIGPYGDKGYHRLTERKINQ